MQNQLMFVGVTLPGGFTCLILAFVLLQHALTNPKACDFARTLYGASAVVCLALSYNATVTLLGLLETSHDWYFVVHFAYLVLTVVWFIIGWRLLTYDLHGARLRARKLALTRDEIRRRTRAARAASREEKRTKAAKEHRTADRNHPVGTSD